ncbi:hypothetical protein XENOCAPTIV_000777, partial [Xenoophorus captivus]
CPGYRPNHDAGNRFTTRTSSVLIISKTKLCLTSGGLMAPPSGRLLALVLLNNTILYSDACLIFFQRDPIRRLSSFRPLPHHCLYESFTPYSAHYRILQVFCLLCSAANSVSNLQIE